MLNKPLVASCVLSFVVACGGGPKPAAAPAPASARVPAPAPVTAAERRLTAAECAASVDHAIAILAAGPDVASAAETMRTGRDGFIAQCEATATVRDRDCLMAAHDARELGLCPMPGTR